MTKTAGRPKQKPVRVTVTLAPHHAAELELMAQEAGVKISAYCAHVLERYSLQDRQVMTTDILKVSFDKQSDLLREDVRVSLNEQFNRVRSLLARTSIESGATRQMVNLILQREFGKEKGKHYYDQAWNHSVHYLKDPTPQIRAAIQELSSSMAHDDPTLLIKVRESADQMTEKLAQVDALTAQVEQLQQQQNQIVQALNTLIQQNRAMQNTVTQAVKRLDDTEEELRNKPKGLFGR